MKFASALVFRFGLRVLLAGCVLATAACAPMVTDDDATTASALGDDPRIVVHPSLRPVVLVHGFNASPDSARAFSSRLVDHFHAVGQPVFVAQLTPFASSEVRAGELADAIAAAKKQFHATKVHIVAHSQGGLDARIVASPGGMNLASSIASITTLSTPHHGTAVADFAARFVGDGRLVGVVADWLEDIFVSSLNDAAHAACDAGRCNLSDAVETMREEDFDPRFNAQYPDASGVVYQSVAGVSTRIYGTVDGTGCAVAPADDLSPETTRRLASAEPDAMTNSLRFSSLYVGHYKDEPNDGVVLVSSSKWGQFRGCLITDHYGVIDQGRYAGHADYDNGFDVLSFYDRLINDLASHD